MTNRPNPVRRYSRFPVRWTMLYGSDELVAEGTVLDVTSLGWRLSGSMPVVPGMPLALKISIPERSAPLHIQRATVLWVKDHEFAIEANEMAPIDQAWVEEFLRHKLGLMWMSPAPDQEPLIDTTVAPHLVTALSLSPMLSIEDIQRRFSVAHIDSTETPTEACWNDDSVQQSDGLSPLLNTTIPEARRIVRTMLAHNAVRARTGQDQIMNN